MTVQTLTDAEIFNVLVPGNKKRNISKVFCCDLLSIAMSRAPENGAWVTVMANKNTLAVASLADITCIVLAEGVTLSRDDILCAEREEISIFTTDLPIFDAAVKIQALI